MHLRRTAPLRAALLADGRAADACEHRVALLNVGGVPALDMRLLRRY